jgi:NAD(P)-dependent dehydrogenase (short-subunit alcohol dehydrogenase family)
MNYVITGANRGIGLEFIRQLSDRGATIHATARRPDEAQELQALADAHDVTVHPLDVTDPTSVEAFGEALDGVDVDVLINNAGVLHRGGGPDGFDFDEIETDFQVNAIGTLRVIEALKPRVAAAGGGKIVNITSKMGSIADNGSGGSYAYRMSKCALNMATKSLAADLEGDDIVTFVMHPGWVQTRMGGDNALISPEKSVANMLERIAEVGPDQSGQFIEWDGGQIPW